MFLKKFIILCSITTSISYAIESKPQDCQSTKEFITTLNYLKSKKDFGIQEKDSIDIAKVVAGGCVGAANRFIQTANFLTDAEIPTQEALTVAKTISKESDQIHSNFQNIFKKIYIEKYFDLSEKKSMKFALELTAKMDKSAGLIMEDFNTLGEFCLNRNGLDLGFDKCSDFIFNVLKKSQDLNVTIGKPAIAFYDFLMKEEKGPKLTTPKALHEIETVIEFGSNGIENYTAAYLFATNPEGLNLTNEKALSFANEMARKSIKK